MPSGLRPWVETSPAPCGTHVRTATIRLVTTHPDATAIAEAARHEGELPADGRVVEGGRKVRMADAGPDRRARLDAIARYLHDVAEDDASSAALPSTVGWVLRSTRMEIGRFPTLGEDLVLHTFCSATASRWAERTTVAHGSRGARIRAVSVWVAIDVDAGTPARLGDWFFSIYGPSAGGRHASARLGLHAPDDVVALAARPWPIRRSDLDAWAHVNNAVAWAAVEDAVEIGAADSMVALVEHHAPIGPDAEPVLATDRDGDEWSVWLLEPGKPPGLLVASKVELHRGRASPSERSRT